jgi:hypothetical protein
MKYTIEITDENDELGLGFATLHVEVEFIVHAGDPGCRRDSNGDGWPPTPDEVELLDWRLLCLSSKKPGTADFTQDVVDRARWMVENYIEENREAVDGKLLELAEDRS